MASGDDRSLLDRLNALKPSGIALDNNPHQSTQPALSIEPSKPPGREDALAARLRSLRNRREADHVGTSLPAGPGGSQTVPPSAKTQPPAGGVDPAVPPIRGGSEGADVDGGGGNDEEEDVFFLVGDQDLDELLGGLDLADHDVDPAPEAAKVSRLLEKFEKESGRTGDQDTGEGKGSDESDGGDVDREVENILSRALDEVRLDREADHHDVTVGADASEPQRLRSPSPGDRTQQDDYGGGGLSLPTVPSQLVEPADDADRSSVDFESDIAARMAALRGLGGGGGGGAVDALGLPSAPTYQPGDRPVKGVIKKPGYTDEDARTWCVVCLDDATIRCVDCDDDGYCVRCWREMHVGPSAGYDERGHKWVKFER